jgi:hypothetical protein
LQQIVNGNLIGILSKGAPRFSELHIGADFVQPEPRKPETFWARTRLGSQGNLQGGLAMLNMIPGTQSALTAGITVTAALVALINLVGGPSLYIWDQLQPNDVAYRLATAIF